MERGHFPSSLSRQNVPASSHVVQCLSETRQSTCRAWGCSSCLPSCSEATSWRTPPNSVVLLGGVLRAFSTLCLFHLLRRCRSVCQNNAVDWKCVITEVKSHNYHFWYSISLNIASFSGIHTLQNEYKYFYCKHFCHFSLDWCSGDQSNF